MIAIGKVTGQEIKENRNGGVDVRLLQVQMSNDSDIETAQYFPMSGDDSPPQIGDMVALLSIGPAFVVAIGVQDSVVPSMNEGEKKSFSRDGAGAIAAYINYLSDGNLELNGNAFTAVRFQNLETAFDELKGVVNNHSHLYTPGTGTPTQTAVGTPQSAADISTAESETVKLK